jgi:hypothetical protein
MEDLSPSEASENEPSPQAAAPQFRRAEHAPLFPSPRAWIATHAGAVMSAIGVCLVCLALFLPWFFLSPGLHFSEEVLTGGWEILYFPLVPPDGGYDLSTCLVALPFLTLDGFLTVALISNVVALFQPGVPAPKRWHLGILLFPILGMLAVNLIPTDYAGIAPGYWLALGAFLLILLGNLLQRMLVRRARSTGQSGQNRSGSSRQEGDFRG